MNRVAEDLYPMRVNPQNFSNGDVVKKIYMDNIQTPYTGVVTRPIPSTNKVEVQWPHGMGMEDPWDLIKINPMITPPVVDEDKSYKTYQNQSLRADEMCKQMQPYNILKEYYSEKVKPLLLHASKLYNKGTSKKKAFDILASRYDDRKAVVVTLNKIFNDKIKTSNTLNIKIGGETKKASLYLIGTSDTNFKFSYSVEGGESQTFYFDNFKESLANYRKYKGIFDSLRISSRPSDSSIVAHVNRIRKVDSTIAYIEED